jgi:hypothetical protein
LKENEQSLNNFLQDKKKSNQSPSQGQNARTEQTQSRGRYSIGFEEASEQTKRKKVQQFSEQISKITKSDKDRAHLINTYLPSKHGNAAMQFLSTMLKYHESENERMLIENIKEIMRAYQSRDFHLKKPLIHFLSEGIPSSSASNLLCLPESTIKAAKAMTNESINSSNVFQRHKYSPRERIWNRELNQFSQFLQVYCQPGSGTQHGRPIQKYSTKELFNYFNQWRENQIYYKERQQLSSMEDDLNQQKSCDTIRAISRKQFQSLLNRFRIIKVKKFWDWSQCELCPTTEEEKRLSHQITELKEYLGEKAHQKTCSIPEFKGSHLQLRQKQKRINKLQLHNKIKKEHRKAEQEIKGEAGQDTAIVYLDFVAFHFQFGKGTDENSLMTIQDFVFCVEYMNYNKVWSRKYYDVLSLNPEQQKNDSHFVRCAVEKIFQEDILGGFRNIFFFSDGAGKHFKTRMTQQTIAELKHVLGPSVQVTSVIFAQYHGHNICDSHGGVLNQVKNREEIAGRQPKTPEEWFQTINSKAKTGDLKSTKAIEIGHGDQKKQDVVKMEGISQKFCFRYFSADNSGKRMAVGMYYHYYDLNGDFVYLSVPENSNFQKNQE